MMKNKFFLTVLLGIGLVSFTAKAQENNGFHVAADLNFGVGVAADSGETDSDTGVGVSLRVGYQLTDEWIGMLDLFTTGYSKNDVNTSNNGFMLAGQYYLQDNAYIRPSIGLSKIKFKTDVLGTSVSAETDLGLALGFAGGYEFPVNEFLVAGPTARVIYNNIADGGTFWNFSVGAEIKATF
ncbi:MAG TPA: outer membrane beta-barrel protein [Oligoflexia bacterium]|nr:outer membrane beta-barrel protein [Oligoflexia bacterium]HMR25221.1 outer membrane beta-barrel protein [Oligoflexia bacterium]